MELYIILLVLVALLILVVIFVQVEGFEESAAHLESVYDKIPPTHYAAELPTAVYKKSIAELVGETFHSADAVTDTSTILIAKLNKELPPGETHLFRLGKTTIIDETDFGEASATHVQYVIHRPTKAYGLSVSINFMDAAQDIRIIKSTLDGLVFEDKIDALDGWDGRDGWSGEASTDT